MLLRRLGAEFFYGRQSRLRLPGNVAPAWGDDKRIPPNTPIRLRSAARQCKSCLAPWRRHPGTLTSLLFPAALQVFPCLSSRLSPLPAASAARRALRIHI
jgi:hypothetical protein